MTIDDFEVATQVKLRFASSSNAKLTIEDLQDIPVKKLRVMANAVNREIGSKSDDLFAQQTLVDSEQSLRLRILIRIIDVRMAAQDSAVSALENKGYNERLDARIAANNEKALDKLDNAALEKLRK